MLESRLQYWMMESLDCFMEMKNWFNNNNNQKQKKQTHQTPQKQPNNNKEKKNKPQKSNQTLLFVEMNETKLFLDALGFIDISCRY